MHALCFSSRAQKARLDTHVVPETGCCWVKHLSISGVFNVSRPSTPSILYEIEFQNKLFSFFPPSTHQTPLCQKYLIYKLTTPRNALLVDQLFSQYSSVEPCQTKCNASTPTIPTKCLSNMIMLGCPQFKYDYVGGSPVQIWSCWGGRGLKRLRTTVLNN